MNDSLTRRQAIAGIGAVALTSFMSACNGGFANTIAVGSKEFTEELLLGEMYAQLLEHGGLHVHRRLGLGGTQVAMSALQRGAIDLYPEYTGTALLNQLKLPLMRDSTAINQGQSMISYAAA